MLQKHLTKSDKMLEISNVMIAIQRIKVPVEDKSVQECSFHHHCEQSSGCSMETEDDTAHFQMTTQGRCDVPTNRSNIHRPPPALLWRFFVILMLDTKLRTYLVTLPICYKQLIRVQITVLILCFIYCNCCKHKKVILSSSTNNT